MLFVLRKLVLYSLKPMSILVFFLLLVGFRKRSRLFLALGLVVYLMGVSPVADLFIAPLEGMVASGRIDPSVKDVVVLTGDMYSRETPLSSTGCSSLKRLMGAVSLCRRLGGCRLILSGGSLFGETPGSMVMEKFLRELGNFTVVAEAFSKTTKENALMVKGIVGNSPFYLVTSAYHMPRSLYLFQRLGMNPIPYPVDYQREKRYTLQDFFPQGRNVRKVELALHEYMGLLFYCLFPP